MPPAEYSGKPRSGRQADGPVRLLRLLRLLIDRATGRQRVRRRPHREGGRGSSAKPARTHERRAPAPRQDWIERQEVRLWHLGVFACVLIAMIWVGWSVIAQTAAQNLAVSDPDAALSWYADEPAALDKLAADELSGPKGNLDAARAWAQRALRSNPLDDRALFLLGLTAERKGDPQRADTLMQISGARSWRERATQSWLFNRAVRRGDFANALPHVDAILRVNLDAYELLFPVLAAFTVDPNAFKALTDFLTTSPPWRSWFLARLSAQLANQARLVQLYSALKDTPNPPTTGELKPYLNRLIKDGDFERAHQIWRSTLPATLSATEILLYNGDFELAVNDLPFNWELRSITGADMQIAAASDGRKTRVLHIEFSGARVLFANVRQLLVLPPGNYSLTGRQKAEGLRAARGLWWRIFCADNPKTVLGRTELVLGPLPWSDFTLQFRVPASGCKAQWLQLELPARIASEQTIEGEVSYEHLRIVSAQTTGPAPESH